MKGQQLAAVAKLWVTVFEKQKYSKETKLMGSLAHSSYNVFHVIGQALVGKICNG